MKKLALIATFLLLLSAYSYGQNGTVQTIIINGRGSALDTVITKEVELSFNKTFPNNYKRDESVVRVLRPYLVSDIVDPTNRSHPLYLEQVRDAREKLPLAKSELLEHMKASRSYRERMAGFNIANETDLNSITFVHIPVYYLAPNIVFFRNGENIAKYYNLGRGGLKYLAFRNNKLVGYLDFYNNKSNFKSDFIRIHLYEKESYNQIIKLGKIPFGLKQGISEDPKIVSGGHVNMFGYIEQEHLVFSYYEEGVVQKVGADAYVAPDPRFRKEYTLKTAESFFSGSGSRSTINRWLDNTVNSLKSRP